MNSVRMFTLSTPAHTQADVNARSDDGESPLHCCAFGGHADLCRILLRGGAMVDALALRDGDTPLHLAALGRHVPVIEVCFKMFSLSNICAAVKMLSLSTICAACDSDARWGSMLRLGGAEGCLSVVVHHRLLACVLWFEGCTGNGYLPCKRVGLLW